MEIHKTLVFVRIDFEKDWWIEIKPGDYQATFRLMQFWRVPATKNGPVVRIKGHMDAKGTVFWLAGKRLFFYADDVKRIRKTMTELRKRGKKLIKTWRP